MGARRTAGAPPIDRAQFPVLERRIGRDGARPLAYLDSAATSLVPLRVTYAVTRFLHTSCANIHRGAHTLAEEATDAYECARERLAAHLGVDDAARVVFTHGATESLNLAALGWAEHALGPGDVVAVAEDNHHANIVCWQMLAERRGVEIAWIPVDADGRLDYGAWCRIAERCSRTSSAGSSPTWHASWTTRASREPSRRSTARRPSATRQWTSPPCPSTSTRCRRTR